MNLGVNEAPKMVIEKVDFKDFRQNLYGNLHLQQDPLLKAVGKSTSTTRPLVKTYIEIYIYN